MLRLSALALCLAASGLGSTRAVAQTGPAEDQALQASVAPAAWSGAVAVSSADDAMASEDGTGSDEGWEVAFTPYLWVAGTKGEVGVPRDGQEVEIDKSFTDILGNLKFAFMGALDARHGRFVMISDVMYLSVGAKAESSRDPAFFSGKVDAAVLLASGAVGYRLIDKGPMFLDVFAGGRVLALDVDLELSGPLNSYSASKSPTNVSPFIGGRVRLPLADKWAVAGYGDIGGLLNDTDVKWQLLGTVQYDISDHWRAIAGYRHMSIHHSKRDLEFDVSLSGPILGFSYRF